MRVVGVAQTGAHAIKLVMALQPDVVLMDINMPELDGLAATRHIMRQHPTPIVIISSHVEADVQLSLKALEAGAVAVMNKLPTQRHPDYMAKRNELLTTLRAMAGVRVIARRSYARPIVAAPAMCGVTPMRRLVRSPRVLAIGASTGGPRAVQTLLSALPADFPLPIVLVQHMPRDFLPGFVRWLGATTQLSVQAAKDGEAPLGGHVYVATGERHLVVERYQNKLILRTIVGTAADRHQPSVEALFKSVAAVCGNAAIGIILTGMGDDGAHGLLAMQQAGATTIAQDAASSVVFGMPRAAIACGAAQHVVALHDLPAMIMRII